MIPIPIRDEDETTERLSAMLCAHPACLKLFLAILLKGKSPFLEDSDERFEVQTQVRTFNGRIDLLITRGSDAVIVECKVDDSQKVFQLEKYHEFWIRKTERKPLVCWLLRRKATLIGEEDYLASALLWNELHEALLLGNSSLPPGAKAAVDCFLKYLSDSKVLLPQGVSPLIERKSKGYARAHAEKHLTQIRSGLPTFEGGIEEINELDPRLAVGRVSWRREFADGWHRRIWMYYKPLPVSSNGFYFQTQILLYNHTYSHDLQYALRHCSSWATICKDAGMRLWRNKPKKWRGKYNVELQLPLTIELPIKFVYAEEPTEVAIESSKFNSDTDAVQNGIERIRRYAGLVDSFRK